MYGFIVAQFAGAFAATALFRWLIPQLPKDRKLRPATTKHDC
jgi:glycerol uptake facilitator-like aquaporin